MGCAMTCVKYLMFLFNLLVFLSGAALIGLGIWVITSADSFRRLISSEPIAINAAYITIAVGCALLIIGFFGCCGAIKENRCLLGTFFAIVLVVFLLQIVSGILAIVLKPQIEKEAKEAMSRGDKTIIEGWNMFHEQYKCCGMDGPSDWKNIPDSCCAVLDSGKKCNKTNAYDSGCSEQVGIMFWILAGVSFGILLIEILAMIFSCLLFRQIGKDRDYYSK